MVRDKLGNFVRIWYVNYFNIRPELHFRSFNCPIMVQVFCSKWVAPKVWHLQRFTFCKNLSNRMEAPYGSPNTVKFGTLVAVGTLTHFRSCSHLIGALLPKRIGAFLLKFIIRLPNLFKLFRIILKKNDFFELHRFLHFKKLI